MKIIDKGRYLLWAAWGTALLFVPCLMYLLTWHAVLSRQAGFDPSDLSGTALDASAVISRIGWGSLPIALIGLAAAIALRDRLVSHRLELVAFTAFCSVLYVLVLVVQALLQLGTIWLGSWMQVLEWMMRHLALASWCALGPLWVRPSSSAGSDVATRGDLTEPKLINLPECDGLSDREREVLAALISGERAVDVASRLGLSPSSVATYRVRALEKLGVSSVPALRASLDRGNQMAGRAEEDSIGIGDTGWLSIPVAACACVYLIRWTVWRAVQDEVASTLFVILWELACIGIFAVAARRLAVGRRRPDIDHRLLVVVAVACVQGLFLGGSSMFERHRSLPIDIGTDAADSAFLLACTALPVSLVRIFGALKNLESMRTARADLAPYDDRCLLYLRGRGLNELQANVVLAIARGTPSSRICSELHVARGTVNAYRARAYECLGVHSSRELHELLQRHVNGIDSNK